MNAVRFEAATAARAICFVIDDLKMLWINTSTVSAQVVYLFALRNSTNESRVDSAVRHLCAVRFAVDVAVPVTIFATAPQPASAWCFVE